MSLVITSSAIAEETVCGSAGYGEKMRERESER
jgi:hypothetical protein